MATIYELAQMSSNAYEDTPAANQNTGTTSPLLAGLSSDWIVITTSAAQNQSYWGEGYLGVAPQETVPFSGTVYQNLLSAHPHATFEQIVEACKAAEIHETIQRLPLGYQTEIGEREVGLSGGQKQRLASARALIKRAKILIFDEATSNLDVATAAHFYATVNQLKGRATMLSSLMPC